MRVIWVVVAVLAVQLTACGIDETYTGLGDGALPGDPLNPIEQPAANCTEAAPSDVQVQPSDVVVATLAGRSYRISELTLVGPFEGLIADTLNNYFVEQIELNGLNVLLQVTSDDRESGELVFQLGAGDATEGGYAFVDAGEELKCVLQGDLFQSSEPSKLVLPNDSLDPPTLPVKELDVSGLVSVDGSALTQGSLVGALIMADGEAIKILGVPLATFLVDSEIPPDLDLDEDGTMDGWSFEFTFSALAASVEAAP
jgi:hypothetical protein